MKYLKPHKITSRRMERQLLDWCKRGNSQERSEQERGYIHFYEDGAEGKHTTEQRDDSWLHEPLLLRYGPRYGVDSTWVVGLARKVPTQYCTDQR